MKVRSSWTKRGTIRLTGLQAIHFDLGHVHGRIDDHLGHHWHLQSSVVEIRRVGSSLGRSQFHGVRVVFVVNQSDRHLNLGVVVDDLDVQVSIASISKKKIDQLNGPI